ncbi:MAG: Gfo/Idh/MocA family oxidoreductase [Pseudomonadota bacterium]
MIRLGILGAARIAREAVLEPLKKLKHGSVVSIASRSLPRAREFATRHGIPRVASDYRELLADPELDAIYIGLPPSEHEHWTIAALNAGKHVLCEKPFAMNAAEAQKMRAASLGADRVLMEAYHYRFHPLFERIMKAVRGHELGSLQHIEAWFNVPITFSSGEFRYSSRLGGGALMDLGCYPLHWSRTVAGREPTVLSASAQRHSQGVDLAVKARLDFGAGLTAAISASMSPELPQGLDAQLFLQGSAGSLLAANPLAPHLGHRLTIDSGEGGRSECLEDETTYYHQMRHFLEVLEQGAAPLIPLTDSVAQMTGIDAIRACLMDCGAPTQV